MHGRSLLLDETIHVRWAKSKQLIWQPVAGRAQERKSG